MLARLGQVYTLVTGSERHAECMLLMARDGRTPLRGLGPRNPAPQPRSWLKDPLQGSSPRGYQGHGKLGKSEQLSRPEHLKAP